MVFAFVIMYLSPVSRILDLFILTLLVHMVQKQISFTNWLKFFQRTDKFNP